MLLSFIIALLVMCGLTGLLTLLILAAEATIGNYGEVTVTINEKKIIAVRGGRPLLATLKDEKVFVPSACGGRGSCGLCKVRTATDSEPLSTETPWLSPEERKNNTRLACQLKVKRDISIIVPDKLLSVREFAAKVVSLRDLTYNIKEVRIKLIEPDSIDFIAGQFVQIEVPPYALTDSSVYRAYSIASPPSRHDEIELEIRYVPNGICTTYVHKHLKQGDKIAINGPYGEFRTHESDREMICIAGGSGMAPIKAMLLDMEERKIKRKIRYFFGARSVRDIFLAEEMKRLENVLPDFAFIPALSAPLPDEKWNGETGLITEVVGRHVDRAADMEAYLCGSPMMIDACVKLLKEKGMPQDRIYYDKFA